MAKKLWSHLWSDWTGNAFVPDKSRITNIKHDLSIIFYGFSLPRNYNSMYAHFTHHFRGNQNHHFVKLFKDIFCDPLFYVRCSHPPSLPVFFCCFSSPSSTFLMKGAPLSWYWIPIVNCLYIRHLHSLDNTYIVFIF